MKINILNLESAHKAKGLTIVVDVLRAFTTSCVVFNNGASEIIAVSDLQKAYHYIKKYSDYISIGERKGLKLDGFDYGNSPTEKRGINMLGRKAILTTSAGTRGVVGAVNAEEILTGAFVNAQAVLNYIKHKKSGLLSFIVTNSDSEDNEDFMYVKYIASCLDGNPLRFSEIKKYLVNHPTADGFLKNPLTKFSKKDFHFCLSLNLFDFVIKAEKNNKNKILLKRVAL